MAKKEISDDQQLETRLEKKPTLRDRVEARKKELLNDFAVVAAMPEGRRVFHHILKQCGYHANQVGGNPTLGMDVFAGTLYNAARESVYIDHIRPFLPRAVLKDIEFRAAEEIE